MLATVGKLIAIIILQEGLVKQMKKLKWTKQDPECVKGLILSANTEIPNYWLQIYQFNEKMFEACIYGISVYGRFELMGRELCFSIEESKAHAEKEWEDFRQNSRLYPRKVGAK